MWSLEPVAARRLLLRLACIGAAGAALGGCFQPLYGEHSISGGPNVSAALHAVDVATVDAPSGSPEARVAVELRSQLLFDLTGGGAAAPPTHRLTMRMSSDRLSVIVDINSGRPDVEDYGLAVSYSLVDLKSG